MENRSFALDEERSTYTEGESKSRRSSILKPPKARAPLQEVNLGGSADDTEDFDTLRKRRVSFAGVNSVKEFCSQAESLQVCHIQSYEETFSTSSDNSNNSSAAKSVQLGTPKNAVPLGEDRNFADDPMVLTDSPIDNNHLPIKFAAAPVINVLPVVTPCAQLSESVMNNKANLHSWSGRKSVVINNLRSSMNDGNMTSSNMSISSVVGAPVQGNPRNADLPAMSSPWLCSMEITEPVKVPQNCRSGVSGPSHQEQIPYQAYRNSIKLPELSDSGMELTEAVKIRPFSINQANDDFGDMSMEMTELVKKTEPKSFRSQISFTNFTTNKSASMDFTEVVQIQRKDGRSRDFQSSSGNNSRGNCGMDLTEPVGGHYTLPDSSERVPLTEHIIPCEKSYSVPPRVHHVTPFPHGTGAVPDCEESLLQTSGNQSVCDMEMTGVLSLSKYSKHFPDKHVPDNDDVEDMDFTQLMSVNGPTTKKARMSNELEEEPFKIISLLSTKVTDMHQPLSQIKPLTSEQSIPASLSGDKVVSQAEPLVADKPIPGVSFFDDDDTTFGLNFKNNKQGNSPIELSILNDFRSPTSDKPIGRESAGHNLTMNQSGDPLDHEHLLLYSPPKDTKPSRIVSEVEGTNGFGRVSIPIETLNQRSPTDQPTPRFQLNSQKKRPISSFEAQVLNEQRNLEPSDFAGPLRNVGGMNDVSLQARARVSFKDFEIKPDAAIAANESLSTVGLDDSDILKAGLGDMTCPERVPSICMSMTSNLASPCSKSRMSLADRTTFSSSVLKEEERKCEQSMSVNPFQPGFNRNLGNVGAHEHLSKTINRYDDQDTSVSVPFVFKSLPAKSKCDTQKLSQSIPVIGFDESPSHQSHQPITDTGVCLSNQRHRGVTVLAKKSFCSDQLISDPEEIDQDTTVSMAFVFKTVTDKRRSDAHQFGQSFPIIECGEAQSPAQMELTEVTQPDNIEQRKSIARLSFAPERSLIQASCSSGQKELTNAVAVNRKSVCSSSRVAAVFPQDPSGIEMDETLVRMESPKKENVSKATESAEGAITTSTDMEETNVKMERVENQRKSFFPVDRSPLSLSSEETITKPNTSNVACIQHIRKSCVDIDNEDTFAKSSCISLIPSQDDTSSGAPVIMDMEETALNPQTKLSLAAKDRKSFFDLQTSPKGVTPSIVSSHDQDALVKSSVENTSSDATDMEQTSLNPQMRKSFFDQQKLPKSATNEERLDSLKQDTATEHCKNETFQGDPVRKHDVANLGRYPNNGLDKPDAMTFTDVNRRSNFFSAVDEQGDYFPPLRLSSRKSLFAMDSEAQPEAECCNGQINKVKIPPEEAAVVTSDNPFCDDDVIGERYEPIVASSMRSAQKLQDSEGEQNDRGAGMRMSRKSVRFINTFEEEDTRNPCVDTLQSVGPEADVEKDGDGVMKRMTIYVCNDDQLTSNIHEPSEHPSPVPRRSSRKSAMGIPLNMSIDIDDAYNEDQLNSNTHEPSEHPSPVPRRASRKSCVGIPLNMSTDVDDNEDQLNSNIHEPSEHPSPVPRHASRKSCFGIPLNMSKDVDDAYNEDLLNSNTHEPSEHPSPVPRRTSRKSCIGIPLNMSTDIDDVCNEDQLNSNTHEPSENQSPVPRRASRKSCIGIPLNMSTDIDEACDPKPNTEPFSDESKFAIRRNKRKSTIGTRQSENYPDIDPQNPEDYYKLDVTPLDGQEYASDMHTGPECDFVDEPQKVEKDMDLSKDMMNISLNDEELIESEIERLHTTSTPCKPRSSCANSSWDRKRNRSGTAKTPSSTINLALDLSQEMMNISIHGDVRSPLPKKLSILPSRTPCAAKTPSLSTAHDASQNMTNVPIESSSEPIHCEVLRSPLLKKLSIQTTAKPSTTYKDLNEDCPSSSAHSNVRLALRETFYIFEDGRPPKPMLPYEIRLANRDLMRRYGFNMMASQLNWETLLFDRVLGIKVVLPFCEFNELTKIESVQYIFHQWRIGQTIDLDRETVEFIKNRIHRTMPEKWLQAECNTIEDLNQVIPSLKSDIDELKPLINQLHYVKCRHPCTISNDSISFAVINTDVCAHFKVTIELKNSHKMSDCFITVKNITGKVNLDTVRLVFSALPSNDVDVLYRFVRYLVSETSNILVSD